MRNISNAQSVCMKSGVDSKDFGGPTNLMTGASIRKNRNKADPLLWF